MSTKTSGKQPSRSHLIAKNAEITHRDLQPKTNHARNTVSSLVRFSGKEKTPFLARIHSKRDDNRLIFRISIIEIRRIHSYLFLAGREYAKNSVSSLFPRENNMKTPYFATSASVAMFRIPFPPASTIKTRRSMKEISTIGPERMNSGAHFLRVSNILEHAEAAATVKEKSAALAAAQKASGKALAIGLGGSNLTVEL